MAHLNHITFDSNIHDNTTYVSEIITCRDTWCSTHEIFGTDRGSKTVHKKARAAGARSAELAQSAERTTLNRPITW